MLDRLLKDIARPTRMVSRRQKQWRMSLHSNGVLDDCSVLWIWTREKDQLLACEGADERRAASAEQKRRAAEGSDSDSLTDLDLFYNNIHTASHVD